jgi:hypothetical protein
MPGQSAKRVFAPEDPAIHVSAAVFNIKTWMPATSAGMTEDVIPLP